MLFISEAQCVKWGFPLPLGDTLGCYNWHQTGLSGLPLFTKHVASLSVARPAAVTYRLDCKIPPDPTHWGKQASSCDKLL